MPFYVIYSFVKAVHAVTLLILNSEC